MPRFAILAMPRAELPTLPDAPRPRRAGRGVDISKLEDPARIDWCALKEACEFVLCRATRGCDRDVRLERHSELVRRHGLCLSLYHSFQPHLSVQAQFNALVAADQAVGYQQGDLVPCLNLESGPDLPEKLRTVSPAWSEPARQLCALLVEAYGEAMPYLSPADFFALGSPVWIRSRPVAIAGLAPASGLRDPTSGEGSVGELEPASRVSPSSPPVDDPELAQCMVRVSHDAQRLQRSGGRDTEPLTSDPDAVRGITVA